MRFVNSVNKFLLYLFFVYSIRLTRHWRLLYSQTKVGIQHTNYVFEKTKKKEKINWNWSARCTNEGSVIDNCIDFRIEFLQKKKTGLFFYTSWIVMLVRWTDEYVAFVTLDRLICSAKLQFVNEIWRYSGNIYSIVKHPAGCFLSDASSQKQTSPPHTNTHTHTSSRWYLEFIDVIHTTSCIDLINIKNKNIL